MLKVYCMRPQHTNSFVRAWRWLTPHKAQTCTSYFGGPADGGDTARKRQPPGSISVSTGKHIKNQPVSHKAQPNSNLSSPSLVKCDARYALQMVDLCSACMQRGVTALVKQHDMWCQTPEATKVPICIQTVRVAKQNTRLGASQRQPPPALCSVTL
jgi:hypothetical protein